MPPAHGGGGGASLTAPCPQHPGAYPGNPCSSLFSVCSIKLHLLASLLRAGHCGFLPTRTYLPSPETPSFSVTVVTSPRETQQETWAWHVWDGTASQRKSTGQGVGGSLIMSPVAVTVVWGGQQDARLWAHRGGPAGQQRHPVTRIYRDRHQWHECNTEMCMSLAERKAGHRAVRNTIWKRSRAPETE